MFENIKNIDTLCKEHISTALTSGKLSHAVILEGSDEETRTLCAKELAKAILCSSQSKPCNECPSCIKANAISHPDIHFLKKDDHAATIKVDEIRKLRQQAQLIPNDSSKAVFVIFEAQFMGPPAQNALLKIFEEPMPHVCFILTCESKTTLLDTIISRGSSYCLSKLTSEKLISDEVFSLAGELLEVLCTSNEAEFLKKTAVFQKDKDLFSAVINACTVIFRDALIVSASKCECISPQVQTAKKIAMNFPLNKILSYIEINDNILTLLKGSANYNLLLTRFCAMYFQNKITTL